MSECDLRSDFERTRRLLERLNRLYSMLSRINRSIVRAESPNDIYAAACRIAIEDGNLGFAMIALAEPQTQKLVPIAFAGTAPELRWLPLCDWGGGTEAPAAGARTYQGKPCVINDIESDPRATWARQALAETGIRAIASFPLMLEKAVVGVFAVGVGEPGYFGDAELHLLEEVADDISFAMEVLRRDEKRLAGEAKMHYLAFYDARTGLPGRALFEERLATIARQKQDRAIAVLAVSLRRYHGILQALGQCAGAVIARAVANRIETTLPVAVTARLGESEFGIAIEDQQEPTEIEEIAWKVHRALVDPILVDRQEVFVDPFIGIALHPRDGGTVETVKAALVAASKSTLDSGSYCRFFVPEMDRGSRKRLDLDASLRHAVTRKEFELYYQPQIDLASGRIVGTEALLRWQRPNHGVVGPGEFMPMLEETGMICQVGEWVIAEACRAAHAWQAAGLPPVRVAVNLSGRQFYESDISAIVRRSLHNNRLDPHWLELEVTESIILPNAGTIIPTMRSLDSLGISLALDDFGTGYSSLSYLQRLPVKRIKIDRSFVANITSNPSDAAIVRAIVGMAHSLGLAVIAEGVETEGQLGYLRGLLCDEMQGYYFSPPLREEDFTALLREGRCVPVAVEPPRERVLLLVDDEPNILSALRRMLRQSDIRVLATTKPTEGFELLAANPVGVVVCDQRMPEMTGTEFLRRVKELYPATVRIVLSGYTDLNSVIDAVNRGAIYKFLTKPWQDDAMLESLNDAFHLHEVERENLDLSQQLRSLLAAAHTAVAQEPPPRI
jgi:EAL domain-containing protein (putative c-di-GMP-specific phosphodiesterase class I)/FixJ family two-component response regulator/GGDEF domain-containing protein